jgi:2-oxoglutarate dehydrogenase E1 component
MYISDPEQKRWWKEKLESIRSTPNFSPDKKKHILQRLTAAEGLERFLHTKYVGQKRFSLEGGESFIAPWMKSCVTRVPPACRKSLSAWRTVDV